MKALVCRALSDDIGSLKIEDVALPPPAPGQARVRLRAAAVNFPDILTVQGKYQHKPVLPYVPGTEGAGDVVAVGEGVTRVAVGDPVIVGGLGCFAEETQVGAARLRPIPRGVDYAVAAGFTAAYLTAYVGLVRRARIEPGEWLLVHGAAGGVGLAAVDLGKALGARVIAAASTDEKREFLARFGADHVLPSTGFGDEVKRLTGGDGANVVYDPVGGDVFDESTRCIAFDGRLLVVGFTSGRIPTVSVNIPLIKGFSVMGMRAGEYGRKFPQRGAENLSGLDAMLAEGKLHPHVGARFPLARAVDAMRLLEQRKAVGKVVVEI
ncbi:MAG: NADPH:quinone oxidoreductase family protein [Alphaproteobacteria bacterium]|nr:NADPH:quinone oxidoreductase family protein [Alphaproteobacteria bacterium]